MKVKALTSFAGVINMTIGEERDITEPVAKDLIKAGYIEQVKETNQQVEETKTKTRTAAKKTPAK